MNLHKIRQVVLILLLISANCQQPSTLLRAIPVTELMFTAEGEGSKKYFYSPTYLNVKHPQSSVCVCVYFLLLSCYLLLPILLVVTYKSHLHAVTNKLIDFSACYFVVFIAPPKCLDAPPAIVSDHFAETFNTCITVNSFNGSMLGLYSVTQVKGTYQINKEKFHG